MERPSSDEQPASQWQKMSAIKDGVELFPLISQNFLSIFLKYQNSHHEKDIWQSGLAIFQDHGMETNV